MTHTQDEQFQRAAQALSRAGFDTKDAARLLGRHESEIYNLLARGDGPAPAEFRAEAEAGVYETLSEAGR